MASQPRRGGGEPPRRDGAGLTADPAVPVERLAGTAPTTPARRGHVRRLGGDVAIYGSGRIALQLLAFLTLPVLTDVFTTSQYGIIETATTVFSVVMFAAPLGLESASQRSYFDFSSEQVAERKLVLGTTAWTMGVFSALLGGLVAVFSGPLSALLLDDRSYAILFVLVGAAVPVTTLLNLTQEVFRLTHRPKQYVALSIFLGLLSTSATLYLILVADLGIKGIFIATLLATSCALLVGFPVVAKHIGAGFSRTQMRAMLSYGLPFVPVAAATWAIQLADRFFLLAYFPTSEVGVYSLGAKYANLLLLAVYAFGAAWAPFLLELYSRDPQEELRVRAKALPVLLLLLMWAAVIVTASSRAFLEVFTGPGYQDAYKVVGLLSLGTLAIGMNAIVITGISIARKTHYLVRYTGYAAVANIALNFALIPPLGMVGAALATVVTYAYLTGLYSWRSQIVDPAPFEWSRLVRIFVAGAICLLPANLVLLRPLALEIAFKSLIIVAFPVVALALGGVHQDTVATARRVVASARRGGRTA